ncbi:MAG: metallophosphoesterase [Planctomycetaceae bacterium]|nr:metallophosphoesterase [Planctomycetaceae bacterium]
MFFGFDVFDNKKLFESDKEKMAGRIIAIGDIHGCLAALDTLLDAIQPDKSDSLIPLGDFVDRGNNTAGTLDRLIDLRERCFLFPILGNHDELMLDVISGQTWNLGKWLMYGGRQTMRSYGTDSVADIPKKHIEFLQSCVPYCETERHFFTHASYQENKPLAKTDSTVLRWESLKIRTPGPHISRKMAVLGHTAQKSGEILYQGNLLCIDTYCYGTGCLTAFEVQTGEYWQADKTGQLLNHSHFRVQWE